VNVAVTVFNLARACCSIPLLACWSAFASIIALGGVDLIYVSEDSRHQNHTTAAYQHKMSFSNCHGMRACVADFILIFKPETAHIPTNDEA
jgi:hypothetical protein